MTQPPSDPMATWEAEDPRYRELLNPYRPVLEVAAAAARFPTRRLVHTWTVCWTTVLAVTTAGALFGLSLGLISLVASSGSPYMSELLWVAPIMGAVGGAFALTASLPTVGLLAIAFHWMRPEGPWTRWQVSGFAVISGFLSGVLSICVPLRFDHEVILFSLVPGAVGATVTVIAMQWVGRSCDHGEASDADLAAPGSLTPLSLEPDDL